MTLNLLVVISSPVKRNFIPKLGLEWPSRTREEMWILLLHLVFAFPDELRSLFSAPSEHHNGDANLLHSFHFLVYYFYGFLDEMEVLVYLNLVKRDDESFIG